MVAAVSTAGGVAEMAYVGETPWHGLGQRLVAGASIETWRHAAGMNWQVKRSRVRFGEGASQQVIEDQHVLFRNDTKTPLGIVSDKYKITQPAEMLEFFRDLVDENGFVLHTAGCLFGGKRFWALAQIGENAVITGDDLIGQFLLLSSSCDGSLATTARPTTIRVVCNNTLSMALRGCRKSVVTVGHRSTFDHDRVKAELGIATGGFGDFLKTTRKLANRHVSVKTAEDFVADLLLSAKAVLGEDVRKSRQFNKIMDLFKGDGLGAEMASSAGTAWGLVNAATEFVDHHARASNVDNRLASAWFGRGDDLKSLALDKAVALI